MIVNVDCFDCNIFKGAPHSWHACKHVCIFWHAEQLVWQIERGWTKSACVNLRIAGYMPTCPVVKGRRSGWSAWLPMSLYMVFSKHQWFRSNEHSKQAKIIMTILGFHRRTSRLSFLLDQKKSYNDWLETSILVNRSTPGAFRPLSSLLRSHAPHRLQQAGLGRKGGPLKQPELHGYHGWSKGFSHTNLVDTKLVMTGFI